MSEQKWDLNIKSNPDGEFLLKIMDLNGEFRIFDEEKKEDFTMVEVTDDTKIEVLKSMLLRFT